MNLTLSAPLEELIRRKLNSGSYESAAQVIEEALQLLEERDLLLEVRRERLLREVARGVLEAESHQFVDDTEVFRGLVNQASMNDR